MEFRKIQKKNVAILDGKVFNIRKVTHLIRMNEMSYSNIDWTWKIRKKYLSFMPNNKYSVEFLRFIRRCFVNFVVVGQNS